MGFRQQGLHDRYQRYRQHRSNRAEQRRSGNHSAERHRRVNVDGTARQDRSERMTFDLLKHGYK